MQTLLEERYTNAVHMPAICQDATVKEIVLRLLHEGCGGRPKLVELVNNVTGGSQPVRRFWLLGSPLRLLNARSHIALSQRPVQGLPATRRPGRRRGFLQEAPVAGSR